MSAWTQLLEPGPALLILLLAIIPQIVSGAPLDESEQSTEIEYYPVADATGCYYNFEHYDEGDRIITNEPCLNCTCHNRMLMCYLRVCPFTKAIGQDCKVEKRPDQCCPVITCPEVPVHLLPQDSTTPSTAVGHLNEYGCSIDNLFYADGAKVPSNPNNPCEVCYCIRNKTACIIQECTLTGKVVEGCRPVYVDGVCCPVRYDCDHPELESTSRPLLTTTTTTLAPTSAPTDCIYNNEIYADGALVKKDVPCEQCYCMRGDIVCAVQECGPTPLDKVNCTALPTKEGQCCPDTYECEHLSEEDLTTLTYYEVPTTQPTVISSGDITTAAAEEADITAQSQEKYPSQTEKQATDAITEQIIESQPATEGSTIEPLTSVVTEAVDTITSRITSIVEAITSTISGTVQEPTEEPESQTIQEEPEQPIVTEKAQTVDQVPTEIEVKGTTESEVVATEKESQATEIPETEGTTASPTKDKETATEEEYIPTEPFELTHDDHESEIEEQDEITEGSGKPAEELPAPVTTIAPGTEEIYTKPVKQATTEEHTTIPESGLTVTDNEEITEEGSGESFEPTTVSTFKQEPAIQTESYVKETTSAVINEVTLGETTESIEEIQGTTQRLHVTDTEAQETVQPLEPEKDTEAPEQTPIRETTQRPTEDLPEKVQTEQPKDELTTVKAPEEEKATAITEESVTEPEQEGTVSKSDVDEEKPATTTEKEDIVYVTETSSKETSRPVSMDHISEDVTQPPTASESEIEAEVTEKQVEQGVTEIPSPDHATDVYPTEKSVEEETTEFSSKPASETEVTQKPVEETTTGATESVAEITEKSIGEETTRSEIEIITTEKSFEKEETEITTKIEKEEPELTTRPEVEIQTTAKPVEEEAGTSEIEAEGQVTEISGVKEVTTESIHVTDTSEEEKITLEPETEIHVTEASPERPTEISTTETTEEETQPTEKNIGQGSTDQPLKPSETEQPSFHTSTVQPEISSKASDLEETTQICGDKGCEPTQDENEIPNEIETDCTKEKCTPQTQQPGLEIKTELPPIQDENKSPSETCDKEAGCNLDLSEKETPLVESCKTEEGCATDKIPKIEATTEYLEVPTDHTTLTKEPEEHLTSSPDLESTVEQEEQTDRITTEIELEKESTEPTPERSTEKEITPDETITLSDVEEKSQTTSAPADITKLPSADTETPLESDLSVSPISSEVTEPGTITLGTTEKGEDVAYTEPSELAATTTSVESDIDETETPIENFTPKATPIPEFISKGTTVAEVEGTEGPTQEPGQGQEPEPDVTQVTPTLDVETSQSTETVTKPNQGPEGTESIPSVSIGIHETTDEINTEISVETGTTETIKSATESQTTEIIEPVEGLTSSGTEKTIISGQDETTILPEIKPPATESAESVTLIPTKQPTSEDTDKPEKSSPEQPTTVSSEATESIDQVLSETTKQPISEETGKPEKSSPEQPTTVSSEATGGTEEVLSETTASEASQHPTEIGPLIESEIGTTSEPLEEHGIPGEGSCLVDGQTYKNNSNVPPINQCQTSCKCISSILQCQSIPCSPPPGNLQCTPIFHSPDACCPVYSCSVPNVTSMESDSHVVETTTVTQEAEPTTSGTVPAQEVTSDVITEKTSPAKEVETGTEDIKEHEVTPTISETDVTDLFPGKSTEAAVTEKVAVTSPTQITKEEQEKPETETIVPITEKPTKETLSPESQVSTATDIPLTKPGDVPSDDGIDNEIFEENEICTGERCDVPEGTKPSVVVTEQIPTKAEDKLDHTTLASITEGLKEQEVPEQTESSETTGKDDLFTTKVPAQMESSETPGKEDIVTGITSSPEQTESSELTDQLPGTTTKAPEQTVSSESPGQQDVLPGTTQIPEQVESSETPGKDDILIDATSVPEQTESSETPIKDILSGTTKLPEQTESTEVPVMEDISPDTTQVPEKTESSETPVKEDILPGTTTLPEQTESTEVPVKEDISPDTTQVPEQTESSETPVKEDILPGTTKLPEQTESTEVPLKEDISPDTTQVPEQTESSETPVKEGILPGTTKLPEQMESTEVPVKEDVSPDTTQVPEETESSETPVKEDILPGTTKLPVQTESTEVPVKEDISPDTTQLPEQTESSETPVKESILPDTTKLPEQTESTEVPVKEDIPEQTESPEIFIKEDVTPDTIQVPEQTESPEAPVKEDNLPDVTQVPEQTESSEAAGEGTTEEISITDKSVTSQDEVPGVITDAVTSETITESATKTAEEMAAGADKEEAVTTASVLTITEVSPKASEQTTLSSESETEITTEGKPEYEKPELTSLPSGETAIQPQVTSSSSESVTTEEPAHPTTGLLDESEKVPETTHITESDELGTPPSLEVEAHVTEVNKEESSPVTEAIPESTSGHLLPEEIDTAAPTEEEIPSTESVPEEVVTEHGPKTELPEKSTEIGQEAETTVSSIQVTESTDKGGEEGSATEKATETETEPSDAGKFPTHAPKDNTTDISYTTPVSVITEATTAPIEQPSRSTEEYLTSTVVEEIAPSETESPVTYEKEKPVYTSPQLTTQSPLNGSELYTSGPKEEEISTKKSVAGELSTSVPISSESSTSTPVSHETVPGEQVPDLPEYTPPEDYEDEEESPLGPGTCRYGGKVYVSAQQIPRDDPCDFCFCFRSDIICLQQSCPPPIPRCHEEPIRGFCCPRYECPVSMATAVNITTSTTTTTTTLPPHFLSHAYRGRVTKSGCQIKGRAYQVGDVIPSASGPCLHCTCGGDGEMKCEPKVCSPEPMLRQMIAAAVSRRRR